MASERSFTRADEDAASVDGQSMVDVDSSKFIKVVSNREIDIRGEQKTVYECRRCGNRYGRIDHIKRHYRSHENGRAFRCPQCSKSFNRKDFMERHRAIHGSSGTSSGDKPERASRTAQACRQCIQAKTKCSDERPCRRCRHRGEICNGEVKPTQSAPTAVIAPASMTTSTIMSDSHSEESTTIPLPAPEMQRMILNTEPAVMAASDLQHKDRCLDKDYNYESAPIEGLFEAMPSNFEWNATDWGGSTSLFDPTLLSNDYGFSIDDDTLTANSQGWSSLLDPQRGRQVQNTWVGPFQHPEELTPTASDTHSRILSGHEIFKRSCWVWDDPDPQDSAWKEDAPQLSEAEERRILPRHMVGRASASLWHLDLSCGSKKRDAVLLLAQQHSGPGVAIESFPSENTLNLLLRDFVVREDSSRCPFIHFPTLTPSECRTELLSAMITSGSTLSGSRNIWKFGLALQERTRLAIYKALDFDNSIARRLDIIQAQLLWFESGSWSGSRRKMEVAESAAGNVPTMIRRAGVMSQGYYENSLPPSTEDDSATLRLKWLKWVEFESFKRSVLRAIVNDAQTSAAYMRNACFYSADITFTLPASRELWEASDPATWRTIYLATKRQDPDNGKLTLLEVVRDPSVLRTCSPEYDRVLSLFAALHCLWPQQAAYLDAHALNQGSRSLSNPRPAASMWLEAHRQDLYRRLGDNRDLLRSLVPDIAEPAIVCELFMMHLFVSLTDIQRLAGRFGIKESRSTVPNLKAWSESEEPRYAMWHAGQILRGAERMGPAQLHGFYATAVYQACLTLASLFLLKAFGRASRMTSPELDVDPTLTPFQLQDAAMSEPEGEFVILNGQESIQTKSYLLTGQGSPALSLDNEIKPLTSIDIIPEAIAGLFAKNHSTSTDHLPPLLEQLVMLVRDLARLTSLPD